MTFGNSTGAQTKGQGEDTPRIANHLILRVKDEREETGVSAGTEQMGGERGEFPHVMEAQRPHQDPRRHRLTNGEGEEQVGNEWDSIIHRKKGNLGLLKGELGLFQLHPK